MFNDLANKTFRDAFLAENIRIGLAFAIRAIRKSRDMTQGQLAAKAKKPESVISRLEDPNYGRYTIKTLLTLAEAFDVALLIKFVPYSRFIAEQRDLTPESLAAPSYTMERENLAEVQTAADVASSAAAWANTTRTIPDPEQAYAANRIQLEQERPVVSLMGSVPIPSRQTGGQGQIWTHRTARALTGEGARA